MGWSYDDAALRSALDTLKGKTIANWEFVDRDDDPWPGEGIHLRFTDGTKLTLYEAAQAGQIEYKIGE